MIERLWLTILLAPLSRLRRLLELSPQTYALLMARPLQPWLETIGRLRMRAVFLKARATCPAYASFLAESGYREPRAWTGSSPPVTTKENYIRKYSIEARCFGGAIRGKGDVIDESSGSSGTPNNWVRNAHERFQVRRVLQLSYGLMYGDPRRMLLNCFALGPWATGMNVSMSLAEVGILKSIGPDVRKLDNTLRLFGTTYRYLIFGYPPFVKSFVDSTELDLRSYHLDLVVGGEGISEALRGYLGKHFRTVISSYGASDLEINLAAETELTLALRGLCARDPKICRALFGRDTPPMVFQYNPLDYHIETLESGELAFTICRRTGAAPKIRYNLRDLGGVYTLRSLIRRLSDFGIDLRLLPDRAGHFPVLFVYGRADLSVAFYGAKIFPSDLECALLEHPLLARAIGSFQMSSYEDELVNRRLAVDLELAAGEPPDATGMNSTALASVLYEGLARANQDFREVSRMFRPDAIEVRVHPHGSGPFEGADIRLKQNYVKRS